MAGSWLSGLLVEIAVVKQAILTSVTALFAEIHS
jgi:hypothetical protein